MMLSTATFALRRWTQPPERYSGSSVRITCASNGASPRKEYSHFVAYLHIFQQELQLSLTLDRSAVDRGQNIPADIHLLVSQDYLSLRPLYAGPVQRAAPG